MTYNFADNSADNVLFNMLVELYSTQYVLAKMEDLVQRLDPGRSFLKHYPALAKNLSDNALQIANECKEELVGEMGIWLGSHTLDGFSTMILGEGEHEGISAVGDDGIVILGGNFTYPLKDRVLTVFLIQNEGFVDSLFDAVYDTYDEYDNKYGTSKSEFDSYDINKKVEWAKDYIDDIYSEWTGMYSWLEAFDEYSFQETLRFVVETDVYGAWKEHWGGAIEKAEHDISNAYKRLNSAGTLNELYIAINVALQAEHVHGSMGGNLNISTEQLDELSNLDTNALDEWIEDKLGLKEASWLSSSDIVMLVSEGVLSSSFTVYSCR